jgi:hypothetical protein
MKIELWSNTTWIPRSTTKSEMGFQPAGKGVWHQAVSRVNQIERENKDGWQKLPEDRQLPIIAGVSGRNFRNCDLGDNPNAPIIHKPNLQLDIPIHEFELLPGKKARRHHPYPRSSQTRGKVAVEKKASQNSSTVRERPSKPNTRQTARR